MKRAFLAAGIVATLGLATAGGVLAQSSIRPGQRPAVNRPERHPEMRKALRNLEQAKNNLAHGAHDFGGHRAKALDLTDKAIREVQEALRYDRK